MVNRFVRRPRWRSAKTGKTSKKKIFFLVLVLFTFFSLQTFIFIERNLRPPLMNVARVRIQQLAAQAINSAISERIANQTNYEHLIDWKTDRNGKVTGFMLNYAEHMKITTDTRDVVQETLDSVKMIPEHIPVGQAFHSAIIASFGPKVPVRFIPAGAAKVELRTRHIDAGINMLLVEVFIRITVDVTIIIPFDTEPEMVQTEVPISYLLVVGDVPMYYMDNKGRPVESLNGAGPLPNITLPNASKSTITEHPAQEAVEAGAK